MTTSADSIRHVFYAALLSTCLKAAAFYFIIRVIIIRGETLWASIALAFGVWLLLLLRSTQVGVYYGTTASSSSTTRGIPTTFYALCVPLYAYLVASGDFDQVTWGCWLVALASQLKTLWLRPEELELSWSLCAYPLYSPWRAVRPHALLILGTSLLTGLLGMLWGPQLAIRTALIQSAIEVHAILLQQIPRKLCDTVCTSTEMISVPKVWLESRRVNSLEVWMAHYGLCRGDLSMVPGVDEYVEQLKLIVNEASVRLQLLAVGGAKHLLLRKDAIFTSESLAISAALMGILESEASAKSMKVSLGEAKRRGLAPIVTDEIRRSVGLYCPIIESRSDLANDVDALRLLKRMRQLGISSQIAS
ncbi:hypothetical protein FOL47_005731 [Perkinsus chesapeaki]|uniref:Uncharacterized protein n=1 Tax=Perkinsus chesapeaki TaxID=330153 RepID=A0A7J6LW65_PERCH|nr:hypothetical protein FOL47_005731 [Perkinsus chesapeaki]